MAANGIGDAMIAHTIKMENMNKSIRIGIQTTTSSKLTSTFLASLPFYRKSTEERKGKFSKAMVIETMVSEIDKDNTGSKAKSMYSLTFNYVFEYADDIVFFAH